MKVRLVRDARIMHKAGETVEAAPAESQSLVSVASAVPVREEKKPATKTKKG